jgi:phospholipase/lecithinase/hemolysin
MKRTALIALTLALMGCTTAAPHPLVTDLVRADQKDWLKPLVNSSTSERSKRIVIFGDSLSDTGRLHARTRILYPPEVYWHSRASNGPNWIDYVSRALTWKTLHYAVAGAATGSVGWFRDLFIPSLQEQVDEYLDETENEKRSSDLAIIWIGPNNYLSDPPKASVSGAIQDIETAVTELHEEGVRSFVLGTMPELGGLPAYQKPSAHATDKKLRDFTRTHNQALQDLVHKLRNQLPHAHFISFDAHAINQETIEHPLSFGFRNTSQACYQGDLLGRFHGKSEFCKDPSGHKFWDQVHPNSKMHCYYASQFLADIQDAGLVKNFQKSTALDRCRRL